MTESHIVLDDLIEIIKTKLNTLFSLLFANTINIHKGQSI